MNSARIQTLKRKFILIAMVSFVLVMLITGFMVNFSYEIAMRGQMRTVLNDLVENEGELPEISMEQASAEQNGSDHTFFEEEARRGMRYFSVIFNTEGEPEKINLRQVFILDEEEAVDYARAVLKERHRFGRYQSYYYERAVLSDGRVITVFVNNELQLQIRTAVIRYTVLICAAVVLITFLVVWLLSNRAIRSEIENMQRQKEFITNASHELKTPLAVIRANTELTEMMNGESEWTQSTLRQVEHMNGLIQNLVMIAKAQEKEDRSTMEVIDVSKILNETVEPFSSLALQEKKELMRSIESGVCLRADESKIRQLASILIDNAFKYCDENGRIHVSLEKQKKGKQVCLTVSNSYKEGEKTDFNRFFERFYRADQSHENQNGYGIGLSMAESICRQYGGKIRAEWKDGMISFVCLLT